MKIGFHPLLAAAILLVAFSTAPAAENWPQFRGPTGQGLTDETNLPIVWGGKDDQNVLWKSPLPPSLAGARADNNQSSPIVWGDRVYATTAYWPAGRSQKEYPEQHVTCYRLADGERQWDAAVPHGPWLLGDLRGGYGAPTPATDGRRLFVGFGSATFSALDLQGHPIWQHDIEEFRSIDVCFASSPILYRDTVILLVDRNNHAARLTAYDAATGAIRWEKRRPDVSFDHTTPVLITVAGKPQMLIAASNALQAIDPENGEPIWSVDTPGDVPSPVYHNGLVYSDSGRGGPGVAVDPTGQGDVTKTHVKWKTSNIPEALGSAAPFGDWLYRLHSPGVLRCFDMSSGRPRYAARLEGVSAAASPIVTPSGILYFASGGKSYVVRAADKLEVLATNDLQDPNQSSAAVAGGRLILKGARFLYCIGKK